MKQKLIEAFPSETFYDVKGVLRARGWEFTETENGGTDIKCCGQSVYISSMLGAADYAVCEKCGKGIQNMFGIHKTSPCVAGMIDTDKIEFTPESWYLVQFERK